MFVFVCLEASQSSGASYRLVAGCLVHPKLASVIYTVTRLF